MKVPAESCLFAAHCLLSFLFLAGNRWIEFARFLPGRRAAYFGARWTTLGKHWLNEADIASEMKATAATTAAAGPAAAAAAAASPVRFTAAAAAARRATAAADGSLSLSA